ARRTARRRRTAGGRDFGGERRAASSGRWRCPTPVTLVTTSTGTRSAPGCAPSAWTARTTEAATSPGAASARSKATSRACSRPCSRSAATGWTSTWRPSRARSAGRAPAATRTTTVPSARARNVRSGPISPSWSTPWRRCGTPVSARPSNASVLPCAPAYQPKERRHGSIDQAAGIRRDRGVCGKRAGAGCEGGAGQGGLHGAEVQDVPLHRRGGQRQGSARRRREQGERGGPEALARQPQGDDGEDEVHGPAPDEGLRKYPR